jgi:hypothetical protein
MDVAVVRPEENNSVSKIVPHLSVYSQGYIKQNQEAIAYVAYQGLQEEGRGFIALTPLWGENAPKLSVQFISATNLLKLPLLESLWTRANSLPRWYVSLGELVRLQLATRLNTYNPQIAVIILGQVEDRFQVFPAAEMYQRIYKLEIVTFCDFKPSLQGCYERFSERSSKFILNN